VKGGRFDLKKTKMMFHGQINPNHLLKNATRISEIPKKIEKMKIHQNVCNYIRIVITYENQRRGEGVIRERVNRKNKRANTIVDLKI